MDDKLHFATDLYQGTAFDNDLAATMDPFAAADGTFPQDVGFVYELARKPTA